MAKQKTPAAGVGRKTGAGRRTKYKKDYPLIAEVACGDGFTDKDLASKFDVQVATINEWKKRHPAFKEAIKRGKDKCDSEIVEVSLFKRATGFSRFIKIARILEDGTVVEALVEKYFPPDTAALIFWLCNRQPERWRRKPAEHQQQERQPPQIIRFVDQQKEAV